MTYTMTRSEFRALYTRIYDAADAAIKKYNPCKFDKDGLCKRTRQLIKTGRAEKYEHYNCCGNASGYNDEPGKCKYLGKNGCTTRSLGCKLTFCGGIKVNDKLAKIINDLAIEFKNEIKKTHDCIISRDVSLWGIIRVSERTAWRLYQKDGLTSTRYDEQFR